MSERQARYALAHLGGQEQIPAFMLPEPVDLGQHHPGSTRRRVKTVTGLQEDGTEQPGRGSVRSNSAKRKPTDCL